MLRDPPRIALVLLASLAGSLIAGAIARGEPAATAPSSSAEADCLAKPNAPSASGNHWYYRLDRASGRRCWYQRPATGAANEPAQARPSTRAVASPADTSPSDRPSAARNQDREPNTVEPATAATQPYSWSTAAPPPAPPDQLVPAADDGAAPAPAVTSPADAVAAPLRIAPAPTATVGPPIAPQPAAPAVEGARMPVLFGAAFALAVIALGSLAARLGAKLIRARRRGDAARSAGSMPPPPFLRAQDTPGLVPPMPREDEIIRAAPAPRTTGRTPVALREDATSGDDAARPDRDSARELEENVRELLHRLRSGLPRAPGASADPPPRSPQELDELLAAWRGGRRRPR
jgi:hypothetical protein